MRRVTKDKRKVLVVQRRRLKREACTVSEYDEGSGYDGSWSGGTDASCCSSSDDSLSSEQALPPTLARWASMQQMLLALREQSHDESRALCSCKDILFTELH